jgi:hypothetical protein|nr:MAG TPA: hypothetical protein [Caudoviricetes sp.]
MQWIRNDKKYDTDTAMLIGGRIKFCKVPSNEASKHIVSNFYKKKSGECFLVVETKRSSFGSEWNEKSPEIITFTEEEAKKWAEENLRVDMYEEAFGKVEE